MPADVGRYTSFFKTCQHPSLSSFRIPLGSPGLPVSPLGRSIRIVFSTPQCQAHPDTFRAKYMPQFRGTAARGEQYRKHLKVSTRSGAKFVSKFKILLWNSSKWEITVFRRLPASAQPSAVCDSNHRGVPGNHLYIAGERYEVGAHEGLVGTEQGGKVGHPDR